MPHSKGYFSNNGLIQMVQKAFGIRCRLISKYLSTMILPFTMGLVVFGGSQSACYLSAL